MRRVVLMVILALALPTAAVADSIVHYSNAGGTITASNSGLTLTSTITSIQVGGGQQSIGNFGTLQITANGFTPDQLGGTVQNSGVFGSGKLSITGTGGAVLFSGTFDSATWAMGPTLPGNTSYILTITLDGAKGLSFQTALFTTSSFTGTSNIFSGDTFVVVPEPGTMGLLGTGLVGIAGLVRRKLKV